LAGKLIFSNDGVHPLDAGHEVYTQVVGDPVQTIQKQSKPGPHKLKTPFRSDNSENAKLVPIGKNMLQGSWKTLDRQQGLAKAFEHQLTTLWERPLPVIESSSALRARWLDCTIL
jgi:hypothetical protein